MKLKSILTLFFVLGITAFAQIKRVDGEVTGKYYNQVWNTITEQPVIVYVDLEQNVYIKGGEGLLAATCYVRGKQLREVINAFEKSIEWSKKSLENKLETTKLLSSFVTFEDGSKQGLEMFFKSFDKGQITFVILKINDFNNPFSDIKILLEHEQVTELIELLKKVKETYKELKVQEANSDILQ